MFILIDINLRTFRNQFTRAILVGTIYRKEDDLLVGF